MPYYASEINAKKVISEMIPIFLVYVNHKSRY